MTFYEKELHRLFDDSERISDDTVFAGKTMITKIGEDLRAKVQFVNTKISGQYDALRLTIINRHEGTVDSETLKFSDIIGMKGDRAPHVWDDGERVDWYIYKPTTSRLLMTITSSQTLLRTISPCTPTKAIALIAAWKWEVCDGIFLQPIEQYRKELARTLSHRHSHQAHQYGR